VYLDVPIDNQKFGVLVFGLQMPKQVPNSRDHDDTVSFPNPLSSSAQRSSSANTSTSAQSSKSYTGSASTGTAAAIISQLVLSPAPMDVLLGRGRWNASHPGNRRLQILINMNSGKYQRSQTRKAKTKITKDMVYEIKNCGTHRGRFLRCVEEPNAQAAPCWAEVDDDVARLKVAQAFRYTIRSPPNDIITKSMLVDNNNEQQPQQPTAASKKSPEDTTKQSPLVSSVPSQLLPDGIITNSLRMDNEQQQPTASIANQNNHSEIFTELFSSVSTAPSQHLPATDSYSYQQQQPQETTWGLAEDELISDQEIMNYLGYKSPQSRNHEKSNQS
jgi:hypothetical protein